MNSKAETCPRDFGGVTDPVEGNINLIQGMPEWCTTATLVLNGQAVLTAVHKSAAGDHLLCTAWQWSI